MHRSLLNWWQSPVLFLNQPRSDPPTPAPRTFPKLMRGIEITSCPEFHSNRNILTYNPRRGYPVFLSSLSTIAAGVKATGYRDLTNAVHPNLPQKLVEGAPRCEKWRSERTLENFMAIVDHIRVGRRPSERCTVCHCL